MVTRFVPLALLFAAPAGAQVPPQQNLRAPLTIQQATALKCSAAFALGAARQARGEGRAWPVLIPRGREFMVRSAAQVIDDTGRTREEVAAELGAHAQKLSAPGALAEAMPPCLLLLDASGL